MKHVAEAFHRFVSLLSKGAAIIAGAIIVYMVSHIILEVVLRWGFSRSTFALDEFVAYSMAAITFLSMAYALQHGQLMRVEILLGVSSSAIRRGLEMFSVLLSVAVIAFLAWYSVLRFVRIWERNEVAATVMATPMWIPYSFFVVGELILLLQLVSYFVYLLVGGDMYSETDRIQEV